MDKLIVKFKLRNETKGCYRYEEVPDGNEPIVIGALYIKKYAVESAPNLLVVEIKE